LSRQIALHNHELILLHNLRFDISGEIAELSTGLQQAADADERAEYRALNAELEAELAEVEQEIEEMRAVFAALEVQLGGTNTQLTNYDRFDSTAWGNRSIDGFIGSMGGNVTFRNARN